MANFLIFFFPVRSSMNGVDDLDPAEPELLTADSVRRFASVISETSAFGSVSEAPSLIAKNSEMFPTSALSFRLVESSRNED